MAINKIDIDKNMKLKYTFHFGGEDHIVTYTDEFATAISKTSIEVQDKLDKIMSTKKLKEIEKMSVNAQTKVLANVYDDLKKILFGFFDTYFGEGTGQSAYAYYNQSTRALATVFGQISHYLDETYSE